MSEKNTTVLIDGEEFDVENVNIRITHQGGGLKMDGGGVNIRDKEVTIEIEGLEEWNDE